jgi:DNA-binding MarR family transcriptional regulator
MKRSTAQHRSSRPPITARPELLVDGSDREFRQFVHNLFSFLSLHTAIRDCYAACLGLAGPQYTILLCIQHLAADGPVNIRDVAEHLRLSGSFVTIETNKLEKAGLISKKRDSRDRRAVSLIVNPAGDALLNSIAPVRRKVSNVQFASLSSKEFQIMAPLVKGLIPCGERALNLLKFMQEHGEVAAIVSNRGRRTTGGSAS